MRANSLALRLFLWAAGWTLAIILVTGIVLSSLYREAVERAFDGRLQVYLRTLVADLAAPEVPDEKLAAGRERAAVRIAAVGLVLAGHPARQRQAGNPRLAFALGWRTAAAAGADRPRPRSACARAM